MSRQREKDKGRLGPFVPLLKDTLDAPAWRAMSHGARSLYVALKRRYNQNNHNNGRLFLSLRDAEKELGSHHNQIVRWYRELQHYGPRRYATAACGSAVQRPGLTAHDQPPTDCRQGRQRSQLPSSRAAQ